MNSAYIIDGDEHIHLEENKIKSIKFFVEDGIVGVYSGNRFYYSDYFKMQIILNGNIAFDNTPGGKDEKSKS